MLDYITHILTCMYSINCTLGVNLLLVLLSVFLSDFYLVDKINQFKNELCWL